MRQNVAPSGLHLEAGAKQSIETLSLLLARKINSSNVFDCVCFFLNYSFKKCVQPYFGHGRRISTLYCVTSNIFGLSVQ